MAVETQEINIAIRVLSDDAQQRLTDLGSKGSKSLMDMRDEIKLLNVAMSDPALGGEEFKKLQLQLGEAKNSMRLFNQEMKYSDPRMLFAGMAKVTEGMVGSLAVVTASLKLFGSESETIQKIEKDSAVVIQLLMGLEKAKQLLEGQGVIAAMKNQAIRIATQTAIKLGLISEITEVETLTAVQAENLIVTEGVEGATLAWNSALLANPVFQVIAGITLLVGAIAGIIYAFKDSSDSVNEVKGYQDELNKTNKESLEINKEVEDSLFEANLKYQVQIDKITELDALKQRIAKADDEYAKKELDRYVGQTIHIELEYDRQIAAIKKKHEYMTEEGSVLDEEGAKLEIAALKAKNAALLKETDLHNKNIKDHNKTGQLEIATEEDKDNQDKQDKAKKYLEDRRKLIDDYSKLAFKASQDLAKTEFENENAYNKEVLAILKSSIGFKADLMQQAYNLEKNITQKTYEYKLVALKIAEAEENSSYNEKLDKAKGNAKAEEELEKAHSFIIANIDAQADEALLQKILANSNTRNDYETSDTKYATREQLNRLQNRKKYYEDNLVYTKENNIELLKQEIEFAESYKKINHKVYEDELNTLKNNGNTVRDLYLVRHKITIKQTENELEDIKRRNSLKNAVLASSSAESLKTNADFVKAFSDGYIENFETIEDAAEAWYKNFKEAENLKLGYIRTNRKDEENVDIQIYQKKTALNAALLAQDLELYKKQYEDNLKVIDAAYKKADLTLVFSEKTKEGLIDDITEVTNNEIFAIETRKKAQMDALLDVFNANKKKIENNTQFADEIGVDGKVITADQKRKDALTENEKQYSQAVKNIQLNTGKTEAQIVQETANEKTRIEEEYIKKKKEREAIALESAKKLADSTVQILKETEKTNAENKQNTADVNYNKEKDALQKSLVYKNANAEEQAAMIQKIDDKKAATDLKRKQDQFYYDQRMAIAQIVINTAVAVTKVIPNPYLIAATLLAGIAESAVVSSQKAPTFGLGGLISGKKHSQGGTIIEAEQGEVILNANSMSNPTLRNIANRINQAGGGVPIQSIGGSSNESLMGGVSFEQMQDALSNLYNRIVSIPVVVTERDMTKTQRRVTVYETNSQIG